MRIPKLTKKMRSAVVVEQQQMDFKMAVHLAS